MSQVCWKAAKQNHHCLYSCGWPLDVAEIYGLCGHVGMPTSQLIVQTNHIWSHRWTSEIARVHGMPFAPILLTPHAYAMEAHKVSPDTLTSSGYHTQERK